MIQDSMDKIMSIIMDSMMDFAQGKSFTHGVVSSREAVFKESPRFFLPSSCIHSMDKQTSDTSCDCDKACHTFTNINIHSTLSGHHRTSIYVIPSTTSETPLFLYNPVSFLPAQTSSK